MTIATGPIVTELSPTDITIEALRARAADARRTSLGSLILIVFMVLAGVFLFLYAPRLARTTPLETHSQMREDMDHVNERARAAQVDAAKALANIEVLARTSSVSSDFERASVEELRLRLEGVSTRFSRGEQRLRDWLGRGLLRDWSGVDGRLFDSEAGIDQLESAATSYLESSGASFEGLQLEIRDTIRLGVMHRELQRYITARSALDAAATQRAALVSAINGTEGGRENAWSDIATRISSALLIIFVVQILSGIYRHQVRLAVLYDSRADALVVAKDARIDKPEAIERLSRLVHLMASEHIDFGQAPESIANTVVDKLGEAAKKATTG